MKKVQEEIKELGKLPNGNIRNNYLLLDLMEVDQSKNTKNFKNQKDLRDLCSIFFNYGNMVIIAADT